MRSLAVRNPDRAGRRTANSAYLCKFSGNARSAKKLFSIRQTRQLHFRLVGMVGSPAARCHRI
jgi:hypothetical protein